MTDREALKDIFMEALALDKKQRVVTISELHERKEQIEKALEVLEVLRPHLINAGIGKFDNVEDNEIFHLKLTLSGEEYNKLKEWLENDNTLIKDKE